MENKCKSISVFRCTDMKSTCKHFELETDEPYDSDECIFWSCYDECNNPKAQAEALAELEGGE